MMRLYVHVEAHGTHEFLVTVQGDLAHPKALNDALGRRLARELQGHFIARNREPNNMAAPKTNFWKQISDATAMTEATDAGATVTIAETRFRIHFYGGIIRPTGGRKFLTIPLIKEARGKRVADYEQSTGHKLFRPGYKNVLLERSSAGTSAMIGGQRATVRKRGGFREITTSNKGKVRAVYALKKQVSIKSDPRALPPTEKLVVALNDTAQKWLSRQTTKLA